MGKVVKAIAVIAVAAAVIYFAPQISAFLAQSIGSTAAGAVTNALVATAVGSAIGVVAKALVGSPSATTTYWPHGANPVVTQRVHRPIGPKGWRNPIFLPWSRFSIEPSNGTCLAPTFRRSGWIVIDREADVREGDAVCIRVADQRRYYLSRASDIGVRRFLWWATGTAMVKRFIGVADGRMVYEHTNPHRRIETPTDEVRLLYRVRFHGSLIDAIRAWRAIRENPAMHDIPLLSTRRMI